jgi:hypothetical protein
MGKEVLINKREAIELLCIPEKNFQNYFQSSGEISGIKEGGRWFFDKDELLKWKALKESRTVFLSMKEYEACFEFAIKMAYSTKASHGTGIRGVRSEVQMADDFILGILAEHGVQKFLQERFNTKIKLDMEVHPDHITPQDFDGIEENGIIRKVKLGVAVKSSKIKSCFNIIAPIEYENSDRKSDIYIFVRVGLPSDHLFRILRGHSFFKNVASYLQNNNDFRKIEELREIPVWICGFSYYDELEKVNSIPGQEFEGYRYVKSVAKMHNSDTDWVDLIKKL